MVYNSDAMNVRPIIQVNLPSANNAALPGYVTLETLPDGATRGYQYQTAFHALVSMLPV